MVTVDELKELFSVIFGNEVDVSSLDENSNLIKDVGMNSISFLYMATALEEKYSIQFTNDDFVQLATVKDVIKIVEGKVHDR